MNPSCNCEDVILIFAETENNESEFALRLSLKKKSYEILDVYSISKKQVDDIVKVSLLNSGATIAILKERYKEMKEAGKAVLQEDKEKKRKVIPLSEEKPKRNDPCPCGSGQKYKKCCGV